MPTGEVLHPGQYELGGRVADVDGDLLAPLTLSAGILQGLEATIAYPGRLGAGLPITGSVIYQLVGASPADPTRVAVGLTNIGLSPLAVPGAGTPSFVSPNNFFLVVSRDLNVPIAGQLRTIASGHLGFTGSAGAWPFVDLDSRFMAGLELPISDALSVYGEYFGPSSLSGQYFDVGLRFEPLADLELDLESLGEPGLAGSDRAYVLGVSYRGEVPLGGPSKVSSAVARVALAPVPATPPSVVSAPPDLVAPDLSPPTAPVTTLYGTITGPQGHPLVGARVGLLELDRWSRATPIGGYFVEAVPKGNYTLAVRDRQGAVVATRSVEVPGDGPLREDLAVGDPTP